MSGWNKIDKSKVCLSCEEQPVGVLSRIKVACWLMNLHCLCSLQFHNLSEHERYFLDLDRSKRVISEANGALHCKLSKDLANMAFVMDAVSVRV